MKNNNSVAEKWVGLQLKHKPKHTWHDTWDPGFNKLLLLIIVYVQKVVASLQTPAVSLCPFQQPITSEI